MHKPVTIERVTGITMAAQMYADTRFEGSMKIIAGLADWTPSQIALIKQELAWAFEAGVLQRLPIEDRGIAVARLEQEKAQNLEQAMKDWSGKN